MLYGAAEFNAFFSRIENDIKSFIWEFYKGSMSGVIIVNT